MKFSVDKCYDCGLDLTAAEPAEVTYPGNDQALGACPGCGKLHWMIEVTPSPEPPKPRGGRRKASEPTLEPEPELESELELEE